MLTLDDAPFTQHLIQLQTPENEMLEVSPGVTIIVGPNGSGKSYFLRESWAGRRLKAQRYSHSTSSADTVIEWYRNQPGFHGRPAGPYQIARGVMDHVRFDRDDIDRALNEGMPLPGTASTPLLIDATSRLSAPEDIPVDEEPGPVTQLLYNDDALANLNTLLRRTVGTTVSPWISPMGMLLVVGDYENSRDRWKLHQQEMESREKVVDLGDGLRSFIGILVRLFTSERSILLIDEPEAFLHPPYARMLGIELARLARPGKQIVIATHSQDIISGVLAGASEFQPSIARFTRPEIAPQIHSVPEDTINSIRTMPLFQRTDLVSALFYDGVVLCEADSDASVFHATFEYHLESGGARRDLLFTTVLGGYSRFDKAIVALRSMAVPVATVLDMDALGNTAVLSRIISAHGSSESDLGLATNLKTIRNYVDTKSGRRPPRKELRSMLRDIFNSEEPELSQDEWRTLREAVSVGNGWREVKRAGEKYFPRSIRPDIPTILTRLSSIGIFIVPVGELEEFFDKVPFVSKTEDWAPAVLERELHKTQGEHADFVSNIDGFFSKSSHDAETPIP